MTDWTYILINGVWVLGLAIVLAVISFNGYSRFLASASQHPDTETAQDKKALTGIRAIVERFTRLELLWLALLFPFFFFPALPSAALLLALPALWAVRFVARGRLIQRTPFDWAIFSLLLTLLVSTWALGTVVDLSQVTAILFGVGLYYAIVEWATYGSNGNRLRQAITGYAFAGAILALIAFLGTNWVGDKFTILRRITRRLPTLVQEVEGTDTGFNPNEIAGALLWVLPVLLAVVVWLWTSRSPKSKVQSPNALDSLPLSEAKGSNVPTFQRSNDFGLWTLDFGHLWPRLGFSLAAGMCGVVFLLTQSRSAFIGFSFGLGLLLWLGIPRIRLLLMSLLLVGVVAIFIGPQRIIDTLLNRIAGQSVRNALDLQTLESRTLIWSHSLAGIEDFPLTGIGVGAFHKVMPVLYPTDDPQFDAQIYHAHNIMLQAALDGGLPGLGAYLSLWLVAGASFVKAWRSSTGWAKAGTAGIGAGLLAYFIYGFTDVVPLGSWLSLYFWALLALLAVFVISSPKSSLADESGP